MDALFDLRDSRTADLHAVNALGASEGFGPVLVGDAVRVAVNDEDEVVGFARFVFGDDGVCHVNPVVVHCAWRRNGVGRALIDEALRAHGELRLVARGQSVPFYDALGFESCAWGDVCPAVAAECAECGMREECRPRPLRARLVGQDGEES